MLDHEYSVLGGFNRAKIGHLIGGLAAALGSLLLTAVIAGLELLERLSLVASVPKVVLWPVTAGMIYFGLYWFFDNHLWKSKLISDRLKVPNLSGKWKCIGQPINPDKTPGKSWLAEIEITQSWDRVRVRLKGQQSGSNSTSAAILYDPIDGFRLMYSYLNDPYPGEVGIIGHRGFAELTFDHGLQAAQGEYFNGQGRFTFGTMKLSKIA